MSYAVKEIFKTLQGEGAQMGRAAIFCRFAGCNLWSGREADRATSVCTFCDTDFVGMDGTGGGRFANADALADAIATEWAGASANRYVVLTGGELLLQVDDAVVAALHARDFEIGVETNGTLAPPAGLDWICVSPKASHSTTSFCNQWIRRTPSPISRPRSSIAPITRGGAYRSNRTR
jgi:7-carboxy-7-deazaguanine synthase